MNRRNLMWRRVDNPGRRVHKRRCRVPILSEEVLWIVGEERADIRVKIWSVMVSLLQVKTPFHRSSVER